MTYEQVVGRRNYRYFVCFVVSVTSLAAFVCISCGWVIYLRGQTMDPCGALFNDTDTAPHRPPKQPPAGSRDPPSAAEGADRFDASQPDPWCHDDFLTNLIQACAAEPTIAVLSIYAGVLFFGPFCLCTYHLGLISKGQTTNENIKSTRRQHPERGCFENYKAFFTTPQRPSYVGASGGLLSAAGSGGLSEVPVRGYASEMDKFQATGRFGAQEPDGCPDFIGPIESIMSVPREDMQPDSLLGALATGLVGYNSPGRYSISPPRGSPKAVAGRVSPLEGSISPVSQKTHARGGR